MPAPRGAAAFEPIPPDLDLEALVEGTPNFKYADRIPCDQILVQGIEQFEKLVHLHVIQAGKPLVIEGFHNHLDKWTFSPQWLRDNLGTKFEQARDLSKKENLPLSIAHYLDNLPMLANQWTPTNYRTPKQRLYLKDIDCPELWIEKLREHIPSSLFYLNECTGQSGGPGSVEERNPNGIGTRQGLGIGRAGDLMSSLPPQMRAENMMCYIGHEGTYTPAHREMCASLGQNIMVDCSGSIGEDGKPTKPGSSIWFMTETQDRHMVSEYWLSTLGHDIEVESHFAQIMAWKQALFTVYVVEQKVGDFILIPPLAPHQVWNRGTRTMKAAWNRTTVETLELALNEALPRARMVCRDEQYKNKAIILFTLNRYSGLLKQVVRQREVARDQDTFNGLTRGHKIRQLFKDFVKLFHLYHALLLSESFSQQLPEKKVEHVPFDGNVTCSYCRCNIFNRFLTCGQCVQPSADGSEDTYDVCMECYAMGRSCQHLSRLSWAEQFPWKDLTQKHEIWRDQILQIGGSSANVPPPLDEALGLLELKTLAQVCQEQLKVRPFKDLSKEKEHAEEDSGSTSDSIDDNGVRKKKPKKRRSEKWLREHLACHICCHRHPKWKMAICSQCSIGYCYGSLWRGFDTMPLTAMEDQYWTCPRCREVCNCAKCKKNPHNIAHEPSSTIIGHDTRKFADPRSVEALVDFSFSNTHWLKKAGDDNDPRESRRLQRRMMEAHDAKTREMSIDDDDEGQEQEQEQMKTVEDGAVPIDPLLAPANYEVRGLDELDASNSGEMRKAALDALSAMEGLSRLEHDPQSFIASAGLDLPINGGYTHTAENGISYEYSDSQLPTRALQSLRQGADGEAGDGTEKPIKTGTKRKRRPDYKQMLEDEATGFVNDANRIFHKSRTQKTMAEAKKTGRLVIARAAVTGESLIARLAIPSDKLAKFPSGVGSGLTHMAQGEQSDGVTAPIVQSDLPQDVPQSQVAARNPHVPKRRHRGEIDEDFSTSQRRAPKKKLGAAANGAASSQRRSSTATSSQVDGVSQEVYAAPREDADAPGHSTATSDDDSDTFYDADETAPARPGPKRRSLPAYLARRSPAPEDVPRELADSSQRSAVTGLRPKNAAQRVPVMAPPTPSSTLKATVAKPASNGAAMPNVLSTKPYPGSAPSKVVARQAPVANTPNKKQQPQTKNRESAAATSVTPNTGPSTAELNRRAKMRAMAGEDNFDDDSDDSLIDRRAGAKITVGPPTLSPASTPGSVTRGRGRPRKNGMPSRPAASVIKLGESKSAQRPSKITRPSRGGKVKIVSARKA